MTVDLELMKRSGNRHHLAPVVPFRPPSKAADVAAARRAACFVFETVE